MFNADSRIKSIYIHFLQLVKHYDRKKNIPGKREKERQKRIHFKGKISDRDRMYFVC